MKLTSKLAALLSLLALGTAATLAQAQSWPNKPIRIISPYPAGGGTDTFARPLSAKLTQALGQSVYIENQSGAGGTLGATNAARAPADGYTFFMGAIAHTIAESVYAKLPYNIERDFVPITVVAFVPQVMVVHPKHPFKTIKELVDYARANPGALNAGSPGNGTADHLAIELFSSAVGAKLVHVPFRGAGPMMQSLLGGQIDLAFNGMALSAAQIKGGKLRGLAVATSQRLPGFPDLPTMDEAGVPGMVVNTWYALWAIKDTPKEIVDRMYRETAKILEQQEINDTWAAAASLPGGMPPEQFGAFVHSEIARWGKVVKDVGVKLDL